MPIKLRSAAAVALACTLAVPTAAGVAAAHDGPRDTPTAHVRHVKPATKLAFRNTCNVNRATLPTSVEGAPALFTPQGFKPHTGAKGVYIWHEKAGWRLRVTHNLTNPSTTSASGQVVPGKPVLVEIRGQISASRPLTAVRTVRLEDRQRGEWVAVHRPKRKTLDFRFVNGGFIDGINFRAGCAGKLTVTVSEVVRDASGKVTGRVPLPVFVGKAPTALTSATTPALVTTAHASRVTILRTPVAKPAKAARAS